MCTMKSHPVVSSVSPALDERREKMSSAVQCVVQHFVLKRRGMKTQHLRRIRDRVVPSTSQFLGFDYLSVQIGLRGSQRFRVGMSKSSWNEKCTVLYQKDLQRSCTKSCHERVQRVILRQRDKHIAIFLSRTSVVCPCPS